MYIYTYLYIVFIYIYVLSIIHDIPVKSNEKKTLLMVKSSCYWFHKSHHVAGFASAQATCVWLHGGFFLASLERNQFGVVPEVAGSKHWVW